MASTTSNLGLTKPAGTDKALVSVINTNSDILDRSAGGLMDAIAIVANGNTHAAISAGQYVYVHNHGTLAEGLYTANSAIAANATLTTSNLTADASGGLNALNSNITNINNRLYGIRTTTFDMGFNSTITITRSFQHQIYLIFASHYSGNTAAWIVSNGSSSKLNADSYGTVTCSGDTIIISLTTARNVMIISSGAITYALSE